jgi:LysM repeat protein
VPNTFLRIVALFLAAAALVACTRDRVTPTPAAAADIPAAADIAESTTVTSTQSAGADPVVEVAGSTASPEPTEEESPTPEPTESGERFDYTVQAGETLASIAAKFETDVQTLRELNFLLDDNIFAGQILEVPYIEGMTGEGAPTPSPTPFSYIVQQGDTLSSIAFQFDVQPGVLIEINNILDPNNLIVGTPLLIPGYTGPAADAGGEAGAATDDAAGGAAGGGAGGSSVTHVVQPGESLGQIAAEYGIDPVALAQANNIANGNLIRVGQQLVIPGVSERQALEARGARHIVQSGESLSMIAAQFGVSVEAIMAANALDDPNTIVVGQELLIPPAD